MTIKEIFDRAEGGSLTYDEFVKLAKEAKFEDINEGKYYSKGKHADEIGAKDKEIGTLNETIKQREADLIALQEQLTAAGADAEKLANITGEFDKLKIKYEKDAKKYEERLKAQAYEFAVKEYANATKFTSAAAKRDFIRSMLEKQLQMDGDTIIGADDFTIAYSANNADAFLVEMDEPEPTPEPSVPQTINVPAPEPKPQFIASTSGDDGAKRPSLTELMIAKNENPNLEINFG